MAGRPELRKKYGQHFYKGYDKIYDTERSPSCSVLMATFSIVSSMPWKAMISTTISRRPLKPRRKRTQETIHALKTADRMVLECRLDALWEALIEEFKIVEIRLEEGDDAQVIFETLNERGEPLLAADLVRNNIFHRADAEGNPRKSFSTDIGRISKIHSGAS